MSRAKGKSEGEWLSLHAAAVEFGGVLCRTRIRYFAQFGLIRAKRRGSEWRVHRADLALYQRNEQFAASIDRRFRLRLSRQRARRN